MSRERKTINCLLCLSILALVFMGLTKWVNPASAFYGPPAVASPPTGDSKIASARLFNGSVSNTFIQPVNPPLTLTVNDTGDAVDATNGNGICDTDNLTPGNQCTLRAAIQETNNAPSDDTINFSLPANSIITLNTALPDLNGNLTINGLGASALTIKRSTLGATPNFRILMINSGNTAISGMTITNGKTPDGAPGNFGGNGADGGGIRNFGTLTLTDVIVTANSTGDGGEGISFAGAGGLGGGISNWGTLTMTNCALTGNTTGKGGNGNNGAGRGGEGGAIANNAGTLTMTSCLVTGNITGKSGDTGGIGATGGRGGGIYSDGGLVTLTDLIVSNNIAGDSGLGSSANGGFGGHGGGIYIRAGKVLLTNSTVSGNRAGLSSTGTNGYAGGIENGGNMTMTGTTVSGNTGNAAGGILNRLTLNITNSTISGNTGGGVNSTDSTSTLGMTNCTVTENSGIGVISYSMSLSFKDTIIASNGQDVSGNFNSQGHNLVGNADGSTGFSSAGDQVGSSAALLNPRLGPLANNGGPTQTHALLSGSSALDAGDNSVTGAPLNLSTDQRGANFARKVDGPDADTIDTVDIGAFEAQVSVEDIGNQSINEDSSASFSFNVGGAASITSVTSTSNNQGLVPDANIIIGGSGSTRTLSITPLPNQYGQATITVSVNGSNNQSMTDTFILTVNPVNDVPSFIKGSDENVNEDSGSQAALNWATAISAGPSNESGQTLGFVVTNNNNALFSVQPSISSTGVLTYAPALDANGVATVSVKLKDSGGTANGGSDTSATQTFTITVTAVNDAPVNNVPGAQSVIENSQLTFSAANSNLISIADVDAGAATVRVQLTATNGTFTLSGTSGLVFTLGDGTADPAMTFAGTIASINAALNGLVLTPTPGFDGAASLQIVTNDQGNTGSGGALSDTDTIAITVLDGGTLAFNDATYTVAEGGGTAIITVNRTGGSNGTTKVDYTTSNGTANAGQDYTTNSGQLTFNNGETTKTFTILINSDTLDEIDESVNLTLLNVTGSGALGAPSTAVLTITDDDSPPSLTINDVTVTEGNSGTINAVFTVTLSAQSSLPITVNYQTADGTATAPSDYQAIPTTALTFAPGDTTKTITVAVNGDTTSENDETFFINLSGATNATISDNQGQGTIVSDDTPVIQFNSSTYSVAEDGLRATIRVDRLGSTSQPASIDYATSDPSGLTNCSVVTGNASSRCDYATSVGTIRFAANEGSRTISIPIVNDVYVEGPESFTITLSNPVGGDLGSPSVATITINDNDNGGAPNPIDNNAFFVRQHYIDFLGREPDPPGYRGWQDILNNCAAGDTKCDRIEVSSGFFRSPEFQERGYFVYRFYSVALGRKPNYSEFMPDIARVSGFLNEQEKEANKVAFVQEFMSRQEFRNRYDSLTDPIAYVDGLLTTAGLPDHSSRAVWIAGLSNNTLTRADVLRQLAESGDSYNKFYNEAFVVMQYFGYLRRDPDSLYLKWIEIMNQNGGDYRGMINGFVNSPEYRQRFWN